MRLYRHEAQMSRDSSACAGNRFRFIHSFVLEAMQIMIYYSSWNAFRCWQWLKSLVLASFAPLYEATILHSHSSLSSYGLTRKAEPYKRDLDVGITRRSQRPNLDGYSQFSHMGLSNLRILYKRKPRKRAKQQMCIGTQSFRAQDN